MCKIRYWWTRRGYLQTGQTTATGGRWGHTYTGSSCWTLLRSDGSSDLWTLNIAAQSYFQNLTASSERLAILLGFFELYPDVAWPDRKLILRKSTETCFFINMDVLFQVRFRQNAVNSDDAPLCLCVVVVSLKEVPPQFALSSQSIYGALAIEMREQTPLLSVSSSMPARQKSPQSIHPNDGKVFVVVCISLCINYMTSHAWVFFC